MSFSKKVIKVTEKNKGRLARFYARKEDYLDDAVGLNLVADFGSTKDTRDFDLLTEENLQSRFVFVRPLKNEYEEYQPRN